MRIKISYILCTILTLCSTLYGFDISVRRSPVATELKLAIPKSQIQDTSKKEGRYIIDFKRPLNISLDDSIKGIFITDVTVKDKQLIIHLKENTDVYSNYVDEGLLIVFSPIRKISNIKLTNEIESPLISEVDELDKDPKAEDKLREIDELIASMSNNRALAEVKLLLGEYTEGYYAQEAFFKLGEVYMAMGKDSEKYYMEASSIFDRFTKDYPDNYRVADAMWKAAEAKEHAGIYYESIFGYRKLMELVPDTETGKMALEHIAKIYFKIGQYDKSIDVYKEYMAKYKSRPPEVIGAIGLLYAKQKNYENAYVYFNEILARGVDYSTLDSEILYAMAESFENKKKYTDSISIYTKIYNLFPQSSHADMAMYKAGVLLGKEGKLQLSKRLLNDCKDEYRGKRGALLAALYIAKDEMEKFSSEYWQEFLNEVLATEIDINLKIEGNLFIIESYFREKRYDIDLQLMADFERQYFDSPLLDKVYDFKQQIYIEQARSAFKSAQLDEADRIVTQLIKEFPTTQYIEEAEKILENTRFSRVERQFNEGMFLDTINAIEKFYVESKKIYFKPKWTNLIDKAYFEYITKMKAANDRKVMLIYSRQYLIDMPNGKHATAVRKDLEELIKTEVIEMVKNKSFVKAVKYYEVNKGWVDRSKNSTLRDTVEGYIAYSLYKLGESEAASKIVKQIKDKQQRSISMVMLLLGMTDDNFDINALSNEELEFVVDELKHTESDRVLRLLSKYKKDIKLQYRMKYSVVQSLDNGRKSEGIIRLYNEVIPLSGDVKKEIPDLFLKAGLQFYENKKYVNSVSAFDDYLKYADKKANGLDQALYTKGASLLKQKKNLEAKASFEKVVSDYPGTEYAKFAKSALGDMDWNKKLER